ncbi:MAG TPA: MFS transporter [Candidatus Methanofastidiosa archaeon]|nr:MFS transporter [Candidatus Methanofastidiosa archaeon]HPR42572.1 MFS transporter [Candidatus Methanofastidiosa archaeon]
MELPKALEMYKGLPRSIYVLFLSRIVNSMGAFVRPFLTIFLTTNMGIGESLAGLIVTMAIIVYIPGSMMGGFMADRMGRKNIYICFMSAAALCFIPCAFLGNSMTIPALLILSSFFNAAAEPASSSMVADLTNPSNRKASFSLLYLGINIGFSVGPLIAGFLYNNFIEMIFIGDAMTTFIAIYLVYRYVEESRPDLSCVDLDESSDERPETGSIFKVIKARPFLIMAAIVSIMLSFVMSQMNFALPLFTNEVFGTTRGPTLFGGLMSVNGIIVVVMTVFLISLTKALRPIQNMSISGVLYAAGYGMLFFVRSYELFIISTVIWTLGEILMATNWGIYIANHTPMSHRGRFNAVLNTMGGTGHAISPLMIGLYIEKYTIYNLWPLMFVIAMACASLYLVLSKIEKR